MAQNTEKFNFNPEQAYRLVAVKTKQGSDKKEPLYLERLNCIANRLYYDEEPVYGHEHLYRMRMQFVENENGQPIRRSIHTSVVLDVKETDHGGLKIYTWNSVYILEKAELKEIVYQDAADLIELYLSLEEEYYFARGFYYDKDKKPHELVADVHIGMFTDTVLMRPQEDTQYSQYLCRYYYNYFNVEFYSAPRLPMLIHNVGTSPLEIKFEHRSQRWTIQPEEKKLIASPRKGGDAPDPE